MESFWTSFWTSIFGSILYPILDLILDPFWPFYLLKWGYHKKYTENLIFGGLERAILGPFLDAFLTPFWGGAVFRGLPGAAKTAQNSIKTACFGGVWSKIDKLALFWDIYHVPHWDPFWTKSSPHFGPILAPPWGPARGGCQYLNRPFKRGTVFGPISGSFLGCQNGPKIYPKTD